AVAAPAAAQATRPGPKGSGPGGGPGPRHPRLGFTPVVPNTRDALVVAEGYDSAVVGRWGDPVLPDAPAFDFDNQTAEAQAKQCCYNCDFVTFFPMGKDRGLLWVNHEYTDETLMFRGYTSGDEATEEQLRIALAAHGGSVVELR